ncbi:MAG: hypothetical protein ACI9U2_002135 [Bradymonadia bacterium]|jgi:hypothetical protein
MTRTQRSVLADAKTLSPGERRSEPETTPPTPRPLEDVDHRDLRSQGVVTSARWHVRSTEQ